MKLWSFLIQVENLEQLGMLIKDNKMCHAYKEKKERKKWNNRRNRTTKLGKHQGVEEYTKKSQDWWHQPGTVISIEII